MQCPVCAQVSLVMSERQGIEIDYCPQCRGVWLDRGELDKIIDRAIAGTPAAAPPEQPFAPPRQSPPYLQPNQGQDYGGRKYKHDSDHDFDHGGNRRKKRRGFLGDLFDFD